MILFKGLPAEGPRARRAKLRAVSAICSVLLAVSFTAGCRREQKSQLERGRGIFLRTCAGCHGSDGRGATTRTGFATPPKDLSDPELHARLGRDGIKHTIEVGNGDMPAFGALMSAEDIEALVVYVESLKR